jgi:hypothetical protein
MSRWGCSGLLLGTLLGLLLLIGLVRAFRPEISPASTVVPAPIAPDLALFLSEQSISQFAAQTLGKPTLVNFEPEGQVLLTTPVNIAGLEPVADMGLSLEVRDNRIVSQLHWLQVGLLRLPVEWLPQEIADLGAQPGEQITRQLPAQFTIIGLTTTAEGITLQLTWAGP